MLILYFHTCVHTCTRSNASTLKKSRLCKIIKNAEFSNKHLPALPPLFSFTLQSQYTTLHTQSLPPSHGLNTQQTQLKWLRDHVSNWVQLLFMLSVLLFSFFCVFTSPVQDPDVQTSIYNTCCCFLFFFFFVVVVFLFFVLLLLFFVFLV